MAAATVEPPLRPLATMAGTRRASSSSFASTTFTNPTGTPTTSAGRDLPHVHELGEAQKCCGSVADGHDERTLDAASFVHARNGASRARGARSRGDIRVGHEAHGLAAELRERGLA